MKSLPVIKAAILVAAALSSPLNAQRSGSGVGAGTTGIFLGERLGGVTMASLSLAGIMGLKEAGEVELRLDVFPEAQTETGDLRAFQLTSVQVGWRQRLIGRETNLAWVIGGGAYINSLRATGGSPAQRISLPYLTSGLGIRLPVAGPFSIEMRAGAQATLAKENAFGVITGDRGLTMTPWAQVTLMALGRRRAPQLPTYNQPLSSGSDFVPVTTSAAPSRTAEAIIRAAEPIRPLRAIDRRTSSQLVGQIQYGVGATAVPATAFPMLERLADFLEQNPASMLELVAYTDPLGGIATNQSVAERRGTEIRDHLVRLLGVEEGRVVVRAMGHDPVAPRLEARRVEIYAVSPEME